MRISRRIERTHSRNGIHLRQGAHRGADPLPQGRAGAAGEPITHVNVVFASSRKGITSGASWAQLIVKGILSLSINP